MINKCIACGVCCKLFLINLNKSEYESGYYKTQFEDFGLIDSFKESELYGGNIIKQTNDGSCIYLKKGKCSIHKKRPSSCKKFFCNSKNKNYKEMIKMINDYKNKKTKN
jgi:Fe-S-cluster containining protein